MKEPPNSPKLADVRSGQPIVWMIFRSGLRTRQTSLTPSAQICGFSPWSPNWSTAAPVRYPCVPSASTVRPATTSFPGSKVGSGSPVAAAAAIAGAHADDAAVLDEELRRRRLGKNDRADRLGLLGEEAPELRQRDDEVPVVAHRRRRRDPQRRAARQDVDRLAGHLAVRREVRRLEPAAEELAQRRRVQHRAGQQMRARLLALLEHRDGNVAEPLADVRMLLEQLPEPDRAREPSRPRADDRDADLDPLVARIRRRADRVAGAERRSEVDRPGHGDLARERTSSVSFGTIACRSPTTPMSQKSKIGAFGSLLIATIVPEPCMPTLCWIAPEIPQAMYSFGETDLPVWPTCVEYGYQPASTTARVAPTAPPSAAASSSSSVNPSGEPSPRPPATMMSASSIDGPLDASCVCSTSVASVEKSENVRLERLDLGRRRPTRPDRARPTARCPSLGPPFQPTSTITVSPSAGRLPTSSPSATRQIGEIPVQPRVEARGETGRDVGGENRGAEQDGVGARLLDEGRERVDPRLRERRRELAPPRTRTPSTRRTPPRRPRLPAASSPSTTPTASPSDAAFESTPSPPFSSAPP